MAAPMPCDRVRMRILTARSKQRHARYASSKRREPFRGETLAKYLQCRLIELVFNKRLPNFAFPVIPTEQQRAAESNLVGIYSYNLAGNLVNALCHYDAPCRSQRIRSFRFYNLSCTCRHLKAFVCPLQSQSEANPTTSSDRKCP